MDEARSAIQRLQEVDPVRRRASGSQDCPNDHSLLTYGSSASDTAKHGPSLLHLTPTLRSRASGAPVSFHIRPLKTLEDCALAYADLLDNVGSGRLTPDEAQTISAIFAKRTSCSPCSSWRPKSTQGAARRCCMHPPPSTDPPPCRDRLAHGTSPPS